MNPLLLIALGAGLFFTGRLIGLAQGQQRREERIERQRGAEIKTLLDYVRMVWR